MDHRPGYGNHQLADPGYAVDPDAQKMAAKVVEGSVVGAEERIICCMRWFLGSLVTGLWVAGCPLYAFEYNPQPNNPQPGTKPPPKRKIMRIHLIFLLLILFSQCSEPRKFERRLPSRAEKKTQIIESLLKNTSLQGDKLELFLRIFKQEQQLEVWGKGPGNDRFQKILHYPFCNFSGTLGPKRREGDLQIPEGVYHIDRFNPKSRFFLSLGLNYPNSADRILGDPQRPGSDIFIHGGCATIGCVPITDEKILELYLLAEWARDQGQRKIPVHIFPCRMETNQVVPITRQFPQHREFWKSLQPVYQYFEELQRVPTVRIDSKGAYLLP